MFPLIALVVIGAVFLASRKPPEQPVDEPDDTPDAEPDAEPAPVLPPATAVVCETRIDDGQFSICLYRSAGSWRYRATDGAGLTVATEGPFETRSAAKIKAWRTLSSLDAGPVVSSPRRRHGVEIAPDSNIRLVDMDVWRGWARPRMASELAAGHTPAVRVTTVLAKAFPGKNPFRFKVNGQTIAAVGERIASIDDPAMAAVEIFGPFGIGGQGGG